MLPALSGKFKHFPTSLLLLFLASAVTPLCSLAFIVDPWNFVNNDEPQFGAVLIFAYWIGPILLCLSLWFRSFIVLPIFVFECVALLAHAIYDVHFQSVDLQFLRYSLLGVMTGTGVFLINRDTLFPFFVRRSRFWRKAPRFITNAKVTLKRSGSDQVFKALIQDCSSSGVGVFLSKDDAEEFLKGSLPGEPVNIDFSNKVVSGSVDAALMWNKPEGVTCQIGFKVQNSQQMESLLEVVAAKNYSAGWANSFERVWKLSGVRRVTISVWATSIAITVGIPACADRPGPGTQQLEFQHHEAELGD